jgi:flagellum-specific peptidoglycan hydrolase FlgJ
MRLLITIAALFAGLVSYCQDRTQAYIESVKGMAIRESKEYCIPVSIIIGQAILESGSGTSPLAIRVNNHFGIKCGGTWDNTTYRHDDDRPDECFRKYKSVDESFRDHSLFLARRVRYSKLFKLGSTNYKGWAVGLQNTGYATNPSYAKQLVSLIDKYRLHQYDIK